MSKDVPDPPDYAAAAREQAASSREIVDAQHTGQSQLIGFSGSIQPAAQSSASNANFISSRSVICLSLSARAAAHRAIQP